MKSAQLLELYKAGRRNFQGEDLRGQNFQGKDLSGADFSRADIRGTNFANAKLKDTTFTGAKAGLQKRWEVGQIIIALLVANVFTGAVTSFNSYYVLIYFYSKNIRQYTVIPGITVLLVIAFIFILILREGLTSRTAFVTSIGLSFAVFVAASFAFATTGAEAAAFVFAGNVIAIVAFASALSIATVVVGFIPNPFNFSHFLSIRSLTVASILLTTLLTNQATSDSQISDAGAQLVSAAIIGLSLYVAWQALKGNEKFAVIRKLGIALGAIGGTSFCGADLTRANFSNATLKSTNFNHTKQRQTILEWVCWQNAKDLDLARVGDSNLSNPSVRDLLVTRNGYKKSYIDANFRACNLDGANLEQADLTWSDFSCSSLQSVNLKDAILREALVLNTNFTDSYFTGACLEDWNIDSYTNLDHVDCQYVYLLRDQKERRPSSGDFAPGEFTKLFQEVLSTIDLIFRNGIDWKAFTYSFNKLILDNEGTELSIQSIENKGNGVVVVRVNVPPAADKAKLHGEFNQTYEATVKALEAKYQAELQAKDEQITIYRQQSADMLEITRLMANRPINVQAIAESKSMNSSTDSSQTVNIGGDMVGSTLNLGTISGDVSNVVNQLPTAPDPNAPGLKELLTQLQTAIESTPDLPGGDKADALEQVGELAKLGQNPNHPNKEGIWRKAWKILNAPIPGLPETAEITKAIAEILPAIAKLLGMGV